ncbi:YafY family protein [Dysgonomonas sp. ZJ709]|uniref:helix-turn-helix transcriptional regulator n=1 Tax=Dysgonomonas sp. ZJ709 TaxID=2709797 RepID=UPI0013EBF693|nr:YafY family protein [Dysgonomonas sp. ZJ709]
MNRLERISSILIQLQSRPVITAQQIANQFDISLRTVYRDIRTLEETGIPIIGNVGVGYSLIDGYKLPPLMFTREEAIAFLTAEKFIENLTDAKNAQHYSSGMNKVKAVLRQVEKNYLANVDDNLKVFSNNNPDKDLPADITQCILQSISGHKVIHIEYFAPESQSLSQRDIEPIGYFHSISNWYLIAFCRTRKDYRSFRVDRIKNFKLTDEVFSDSHPSLDEFIKKHKQLSSHTEVIIRIKTSNLHNIYNYKHYHGWVKQVDNEEHTDLYFSTFNLNSFARWLISYADVAQIISPESLKENISLLIDQIKVKQDIK